MDHYIIHVHTGAGWCDYSVTRLEPVADAPTRRTTSTGFLHLPDSDLSAPEVLAALAEELFNAASAPPWDV